MRSLSLWMKWILLDFGLLLYFRVACIMHITAPNRLHLIYCFFLCLPLLEQKEFERFLMSSLTRGLNLSLSRRRNVQWRWCTNFCCGMWMATRDCWICCEGWISSFAWFPAITSQCHQLIPTFTSNRIYCYCQVYSNCVSVSCNYEISGFWSSKYL